MHIDINILTNLLFLKHLNLHLNILFCTDNLWKIFDDKDNEIPKHEAHLWLSLYEFFTSENLRNNYEITQFRKKNLMQVKE